MNHNNCAALRKFNAITKLICATRPQDTRPLGARTLQIHGFELSKQNSKYVDFMDSFWGSTTSDVCCWYIILVLFHSKTWFFGLCKVQSGPAGTKAIRGLSVRVDGGLVMKDRSTLQP